MWHVRADATPPEAGAVRVGRGGASVSYWRSPDHIVCEWDGAVDAEAAIVWYEVSLYAAGAAVCAASDPSFVAGAVLARANASCGARAATLHPSRPLVHGGRYRCVVAAVNAAGLSAVCYSPANPRMRRFA